LAILALVTLLEAFLTPSVAVLHVPVGDGCSVVTVFGLVRARELAVLAFGISHSIMVRVVA